MTFDGVVSLVVNLGVSAAAAVALIWFLYTLVSKTLPGMMAIFREELEAQREAHEKALVLEREYRQRERAELLTAMGAVHAARHEEHLKLLDRLDYGFKNLLDEVEAIGERVVPRDKNGGRG